MGPLAETMRRTVLAAWALALAVGMGAGLVRVLPWLLDGRVGWATTGVFARGIAALTVEVTAAVALPLGAALAAASFSDRGEGLACQLAGARPVGLVARCWPTGLLVAALGALGGQVGARSLARPGELVTELLGAARTGCEQGRAVSEVPELGVSWLCGGGGARDAWLAVPLSSAAVVQARGVRIASDAQGVVLSEARVSLRGPPGSEVEVDEMSLAGLPRPWPGASVPRGLRGLTMVAALTGALAAATALLAAGEGRRTVAVGLGLAAAAGSLALRGEVDAGRLTPAWLVVQPLVAVAPVALWWLGRREAARLPRAMRALLGLSVLVLAGCLPNGPPTGSQASGESSSRTLTVVPPRALPKLSRALPAASAALAASDPLLEAPFRDDFERSTPGDAWRALSPLWVIRDGRLCTQDARNHGVWLARRLPVNAHIEFDVIGRSPDGDLKVEAWGDGVSGATGSSYSDATSYIAVLGGWKNSLHVLARLDEHGTDRLVVRVDREDDDPRARPVEPGQVYRVKIERSDGRTLVWSVDDRVMHQFTDEAPLVGVGHDHFGFNDWAAPVCFDNVRVTPLPG